jgi:hypothetical protein
MDGVLLARLVDISFVIAAEEQTRASRGRTAKVHFDVGGSNIRKEEVRYDLDMTRRASRCVARFMRARSSGSEILRVTNLPRRCPFFDT